MTVVTSGPACLSVLDDLVDHERSRRFHTGAVTLDVGRFEALLARLPPLGWPRVCVHVAGSEGKTSTTETLAAGLGAAGLTTGAYTSPHLRDVRERFRIGGRFVDDAALEGAVGLVRAAAEDLAADGAPPTWFEFVTALARVLFTPPRVDAAVWETGLGGRLDATRALHADVCVITSISLEHTAVLGDTLAAIAAEKAGILRPGAPLVISATLPDEARAVICDRARALECAVLVADDAGLPLPRRRVALAARTLDALASLGKLPPRSAGLDAALEAFRPEGRMQLVDGVLFDGAHSVRACELLAAHLSSPIEGGSPGPLAALVFGATAGRDAVAMARALVGLSPLLVLTRAPGERGVDPDELAAGLGAPAETTVVCIPEPGAALDFARDAARRQAPAQRAVLVTGSLHLVGQLLPAPSVPVPDPHANPGPAA